MKLSRLQTDLISILFHGTREGKRHTLVGQNGHGLISVSVKLLISEFVNTMSSICGINSHLWDFESWWANLSDSSASKRTGQKLHRCSSSCACVALACAGVPILLCPTITV